MHLRVKARSRRESYAFGIHASLPHQKPAHGAFRNMLATIPHVLEQATRHPLWYERTAEEDATTDIAVRGLKDNASAKTQPKRLCQTRDPFSDSNRQICHIIRRFPRCKACERFLQYINKVSEKCLRLSMHERNNLRHFIGRFSPTEPRRQLDHSYCVMCLFTLT